jgi:hypothetical protein
MKQSDLLPLHVACPRCGHVVELPHKPVEKQIIQAVRKLERHSGVASTQAVSLEVCLSYSQAGRYLRRLARTGSVRRIGERGGWKSAA